MSKETTDVELHNMEWQMQPDYLMEHNQLTR